MKNKWSITIMLCGIVCLLGGTFVYSEIDVNDVIDEVASYVTQQRDDDPLMEVEPDVWVKTSNVKGVNVDGETYYYSLDPHMSYDPLSRGEVNREDVDIVYWDDDPEVPLLIYTMN